VIANRAMRVFAFDAGTFVLDDAPPAAVDVVPIDARVIVHRGVRAHYSEARLGAELGALGETFRLKQPSDDTVAAVGLSDAERAAIAALATRALAPAALVDAAPASEARTSLAALYALAVFGYCEVAGVRAPRPSVAIPVVEAPKPRAQTA